MPSTEIELNSYVWYVWTRVRDYKNEHEGKEKNEKWTRYGIYTHRAMVRWNPFKNFSNEAYKTLKRPYYMHY